MFGRSPKDGESTQGASDQPRARGVRELKDEGMGMGVVVMCIWVLFTESRRYQY